MGLFSRKTNNEDYSEVCALCEYSDGSDDNGFTICSKKGRVKSGGSCRRFSYDLTKRTPGVDPSRTLNDIDISFPDEK